MTSTPSAWARPLLAALVISVIVVVVLWPHLPFRGSDSCSYIQMAEGRADEVCMPFSARVLQPAVVRGIVSLGHLTTDQAFRIVAVCCLFLLVAVVARLLRLRTSSTLIVFPVLFTPLLFEMFRTYYLPDLFHAALLALFFCVHRRALWPALIVLFLLSLARETTGLLGIWLVVLYVMRHRPRRAWAVAAVGVLGFAITHFLASQGGGNVHGMGTAPYLAAKLPMNLLRNVFGVELWTNTLNYCTPVAEFHLPAWLRVGSIHTVGIGPLSGMRPLRLLSYGLTTFGIAPPLAIVALLRHGRSCFVREPVWLAAALGYGFSAFVLTPAMGAATDRLIGFAWPLFWIAVPVLWDKHYQIGQSSLWAALIVHQILCWMPLLLHRLIGEELHALGLIVILALPLQYAAFRVYRQWKPVEAESLRM